MTSLQFDAKVWKQGNSYILTIPSEVRLQYNIKPKDIMRISAILIDEKQQKEEIELKRLMTLYPNFGEGILLHKNEEVARLDQLFCRLDSFMVSSYSQEPTPESWSKKTRVRGIIKIGSFLHTAYEKKHYGPDMLKSSYLKPYLMGSEEIHMRATNGKKFVIKNLNFENSLINKATPVFKNISFSGQLEEKTQKNE